MVATQIHYKRKIIIKAFLITFVFLSFFGAMLYSPKASATHIVYDPNKTNNQNCNFKVRKGPCITALQVCDTKPNPLACKKTAVETHILYGGNIHLVCQDPDIPNAQSCQQLVQTQCGGETGAAATACKSRVQTELISGAPGSAQTDAGFSLAAPSAKPYQCGNDVENQENPSKVDVVKTRFDLGCKGKSYPNDLNPIVDMAFALIRFLTIGVGLILAISIIFAGIMYTTSGGNPEQTSKAKDRILNAIIGLLFYLLISALANFLIPGGLF